MSEISRQVARHALDTTEIGESARAAARTFILDTLGVGMAGARAPFREAVVSTATAWGRGEGAHVFGTGEAVPPTTAAYVNGFQIHSMEYDCVHEAAVVHPMATVFAALSAEAEANAHRGGAVTGRAFVEAVVLAVDVAVALGTAVTTPLKFFRPATAGLFGATLGVARLRGLDVGTALSAMGCALAQCAGVMQAHLEGKPTLPVQIAGAARAALVACDLAQAGLAGPESALEGASGYFAMFEDAADMERLADRLGAPHAVTQVSWKPFPTGRAAQGGITLMQELRARGVEAVAAERITLSAPPIIPRLVARPAVAGMSPNYARLCFAYLGAVTLLRGTVGLGDFARADLDDPDILSLAEKIGTVENGMSDPAAFTPQTLTATMSDGSEVVAETDVLFGSPAFPLTRAQHIAKFRSCVGFGLSGVKAGPVADRLIDLIDNLERQDAMDEVFRLASGRTE